MTPRDAHLTRGDILKMPRKNTRYYPGQVDVGGRAVEAPRVDNAGAAVLPGGRGLDLDGQTVIGLPPPLLHIGPSWCRLTDINIILDNINIKP